MPSNHLIPCCLLLLLPSIFPSIRVLSSELALHIRWPKYSRFSFGISLFSEYSGLISFRIDWFVVWFPSSPRDSQESSPTSQSKSINSSVLSLLYGSCQDGRIEGHALHLFLWEFQNLQLADEQPLTAECCIPSKKDTLHPRAKEKPLQDVRRGKITSKSTLCLPEILRGHKQNLVHTRTQGPHKRLSQTCLWVSVSCRGTGQQWPAAGTGGRAAADLGGVPCGINPLGGDWH